MPLTDVSANVFHCSDPQAQLKPGAVELLQKAVPALTDEQLTAMQRCPMRSYDPSIVQEPHVYRTQEVHCPFQCSLVYDGMLDVLQSMRLLMHRECL